LTSIQTLGRNGELIIAKAAAKILLSVFLCTSRLLIVYLSTEKDLRMTKRRRRAIKLSDLLRPLEKLYGTKRKVKQKTILEQALLGILSIGTSTTHAVAALRSLTEEFVDWNELRISQANDINEVIEPHQVPSECGAGIRHFLNCIYNEVHCLSLEFLDQEKTENAYQWLMGLEGSPPQAAAEVALVWFGGRFLPVDRELSRALKRLHLVDENASEQAIRRGLQRLVKRPDYYRFYRLMTDHASMVCKPEEFVDADCVLLDICSTGQERVAREKQEREEAEKLALEAEIKAATKRAKTAARIATTLSKQKSAAKASSGSSSTSAKGKGSPERPRKRKTKASVPKSRTARTQKSEKTAKVETTTKVRRKRSTASSAKSSAKGAALRRSPTSKARSNKKAKTAASPRKTTTTKKRSKRSATKRRG